MNLAATQRVLPERLCRIRGAWNTVVLILSQLVSNSSLFGLEGSLASGEFDLREGLAVIADE